MWLISYAFSHASDAIIHAPCPHAHNQTNSHKQANHIPRRKPSHDFTDSKQRDTQQPSQSCAQLAYDSSIEHCHEWNTSSGKRSHKSQCRSWADSLLYQRRLKNSPAICGADEPKAEQRTWKDNHPSVAAIRNLGICGERCLHDIVIFATSCRVITTGIVYSGACGSCDIVRVWFKLNGSCNCGCRHRYDKYLRWMTRLSMSDEVAFITNRKKKRQIHG